MKQIFTPLLLFLIIRKILIMSFQNKFVVLGKKNAGAWEKPKKTAEAVNLRPEGKQEGKSFSQKEVEEIIEAKMATILSKCKLEGTASSSATHKRKNPIVEKTQDKKKKASSSSKSKKILEKPESSKIKLEEVQKTFFNTEEMQFGKTKLPICVKEGFSYPEQLDIRKQCIADNLFYAARTKHLPWAIKRINCMLSESLKRIRVTLLFLMDIIEEYTALKKRLKLFPNELQILN